MGVELELAWRLLELLNDDGPVHPAGERDVSRLGRRELNHDWLI